MLFAPSVARASSRRGSLEVRQSSSNDGLSLSKESWSTSTDYCFYITKLQNWAKKSSDAFAASLLTVGGPRSIRSSKGSGCPLTSGGGPTCRLAKGSNRSTGFCCCCGGGAPAPSSLLSKSCWL